jgi:phosphatidylglycerophosphate synthase
MAWGAGVFVLARFLDHFDGELARQQGTATEFGARYDYVAGGVSYAALFVGIGIGLAEGALGRWAAVLTALGLVGGIAHTIIRLACWQTGGDEAEDYPGFGGFQLEDGIYLLAPITWFGWLDEFFVLAALGAVAYGLWTAWTFWRRPRTGARA